MTTLTKEVTLDPGQSQAVSFQVRPQGIGVYDVVVNGLAGSFRAVMPLTGDIWELTVGVGAYYYKVDIPRIEIDLRSDTCAQDLISALSDPRVKFFSGRGHGSGSIVWAFLDPPVIAYRAHNIRQALADRPPINISITHHCSATVKNEWAEEFTKGFQPKCFSLATLYPSEGNAYCANALGRAMNTIVENPDMLCYDAYLEALQYFELPRLGDELVFYGDETTRLSDIISLASSGKM